MKIGIVTTAYSLPFATEKLLTTIYRDGQYPRETHLFLHSQRPAVMDVCQAWSLAPGVVYYPYGDNRGLAKSWNEGILAAYQSGCDVVIVVNDDIEFAVGDIDQLARYAVAHRDNYIVTCDGYNVDLDRRDSIGYSCFAINPIALEKVGMFDENITPIYFEDCDYMRRATLLDLHEGHVTTTNLIHGGSSTLRNGDTEHMHQHNRTFIANRDYYIRKWGGTPGYEIFPTPFNVAWLTQYIGPETRHTPYQQIMEATHE